MFATLNTTFFSEDTAKAPVEPMCSSGRCSSSMRSCACRGILSGGFFSAATTSPMWAVSSGDLGQHKAVGSFTMLAVPCQASCQWKGGCGQGQGHQGPLRYLMASGASGKKAAAAAQVCFMSLNTQRGKITNF